MQGPRLVEWTTGRFHAFLMSKTESCRGQGLVIDMNVTMHPSTDDNKHGGGVTPPSIPQCPNSFNFNKITHQKKEQELLIKTDRYEEV